MFYDNLPRISEYTPNEFSASFMQSTFKKKADIEKVARPYAINISKEDMDSVIADGTVASSVMAFFVNYIRNAVTLFKTERPGYILAFKVSNFSKFDKSVAFEYLETLSNMYKWNPSEVVTKGLSLFIVFFYDGRWILAIFDPKTENCTLVDFLARSLTKVSNEELHDIVKSFLKQEFDFKTSSINYYDKYRSEVYNNCGLFMCKFLTEYFIESQEVDRINVTENEKEAFKKILPWLVIKVDQLKKPHEKGGTPGSPNTNRILPVDWNDHARKASMVRRPTLAVPARSPMHRQSNAVMFNLTPEPNENHHKRSNGTIKMTKADLADMLNKVKDEVIEEIDSETDLSEIIEKEGLFEDPEDSQEMLSKSQVKKLLKKVNKKRGKNKSESHGKPKTYEEYAEQQAKYFQEMNDFYGMLNYFQQANPKLYGKIAKDLNNQLEDNLLTKFNLLHLKYQQPPQQQSSPLFQPVQPSTFLPSILNNRKQSQSVSNPRFSVAQPRFSIAPVAQAGPPRKTIMQPRGSVFNLNLNTNNTPEADSVVLSPMKKVNIVEPSFSDSSTSFMKSPKNAGSSAPTSSRKQSVPVPPQLIPLTPSSTSSRSNHVGFNPTGDETWSPNGVFGAGNISKTSNFGIDTNNPKNQMIAKRYGMKISRFDFQKIKNENYISTEVLNFFLGYLREKQLNMAPNKVKNFQANILYFGPEFYQLLTDSGRYVKLANYENVKNWTSTFKGMGKTIFDVLDKIVIIIKPTNDQHLLVCINNADKKLFLFDPSKPKDSVASENNVLLNIIQYMDFEYQDKTQKRLDLARWQLIYGDMSRVNDARESGLAIAKLAHNIQRGMLQAQFNDDAISQFKKDLLDLILRIGITDGNNEDMKWIANHKI